MNNGLTLKKNHDRLRSWYLFEVALGLTLLFTYFLAILIVFIISLNSVTDFAIVLYWMLGAGALLLLILVIILPLRARSYQRKLTLKTFEELNHDGIKLLPFFLKGIPTVALESLIEAGISVSEAPCGQSSYEFKGRMVNVLHFQKEAERFAVIHLPRRENPYYLQITNGKFVHPKKYKGIDINQLFYVTSFNLTYFATSGPPNVNIYLRRNLETRFVKLIETLPLTYQYIITYTDEFLLVKPWYGILPLRLSAKYSGEYYERIYDNLLSLQVILAIMLEKGV